MSIIKELPKNMIKMAILKYYVLKIFSDDIRSVERDSQFIDTKVKEGFERLFSASKTKKKPQRNERPSRRRLKVETKKLVSKESEVDDSKDKDSDDSIIDQLDKKLYGLIVPRAGNFLPDFFEMIKLMTMLNPIIKSCS